MAMTRTAMDQSQSRRGRPEKQGDTEKLRQVADLMVREPQLRSMTAIGRLAAGWGDEQSATAASFRLRRKWRDHEPELLEAARQRRSQQELSQLVEPFRLVGSAIFAWACSPEGRAFSERTMFGMAAAQNGIMRWAQMNPEIIRSAGLVLHQLGPYLARPQSNLGARTNLLSLFAGAVLPGRLAER